MNHSVTVTIETCGSKGLKSDSLLHPIQCTQSADYKVTALLIAGRVLLLSISLVSLTLLLSKDFKANNLI